MEVEDNLVGGFYMPAFMRRTEVSEMSDLSSIQSLFRPTAKAYRIHEIPCQLLATVLTPAGTLPIERQILRAHAVAVAVAAAMGGRLAESLLK